MLFRAVFWIGLVSLLMPKEPDLGLGRPGAGTPLAAVLSHLTASGHGPACDGPAGACAGGLALLSSIENSRGRSLAEVKAEIAASIKSRGEHLLWDGQISKI